MAARRGRQRLEWANGSIGIAIEYSFRPCRVRHDLGNSSHRSCRYHSCPPRGDPGRYNESHRGKKEVSHMLELIRKSLLAGLGAGVITKEKAEEAIKDL